MTYRDGRDNGVFKRQARYTLDCASIEWRRIGKDVANDLDLEESGRNNVEIGRTTFSQEAN